MIRYLTITGLCCAIAFAANSAATAQEASADVTAIKIYQVGDLVAREAVRESVFLKPVTPAEWSGEHATTIESLNKLAKLVATMVASESGAVACHEESLSLIVRETATGHAQVAELLEQLRAAERPVVELTLIPIQGIRRDSQSQPLNTEQKNRFLELMKKRILTREEAEQVEDIGHFDPNSETAMLTPAPIRMANGRKTTFGSVLLMPFTATAILKPKTGEILVRLDNIADDINKSGTMPIQSQSFSVPAGGAALVATYCDGGECFWLVTPKRIEPERKVTDRHSDKSLIASETETPIAD